MIVGIVGSGAMGSGIAQVAAIAGKEVRLLIKVLMRVLRLFEIFRIM